MSAYEAEKIRKSSFPKDQYPRVQEALGAIPTLSGPKA